MDYCNVFISCLYFHSDGTHSLQEDPLMSRRCKAKFLKICSVKEKKNYGSIPLNNCCDLGIFLVLLVCETYSYFVLLVPWLSNRASVSLWTVSLLPCGPAFSAECPVGPGFSAVRSPTLQPDLSMAHQSDSVTHLYNYSLKITVKHCLFTHYNHK